MSLTLIRSALTTATRGMSIDAWLADEQIRADNVARYRRYMDGDHDADMTPEMRRMLRVRAGREFTDNYMPVIVDTMADRLHLERVEADSQGMTEWIQKVATKNRLDGLQTDVHEAAIRDGYSYIMVSIETDRQGKPYVKLSLECAFDGVQGVQVFYETYTATTPLYAVKSWCVTDKSIADTVRVNVYHADRIERFISVGGASGSLVPFTGDNQPAVIAWVANGQPIGVPFIPFRNRATGYNNYGLSEIDNAIPLQDALNRTVYSMVMTGELTAFDVKVMIGAEFPSAVTPGLALSFMTKDPTTGAAKVPNAQEVEWLKSIRAEKFEAGSVEPFIGMANHFKSEIFEVTNTPTESAADGASGESLKQREIKLLGKVKKFQVKNGNAWEDVFELAARVSSVFTPANKAPAYETLTAKWRDPQMRNNREVIELAKTLNDSGLIDQRTALDMIAPIFDWNEQKIDEIIEATQAEKQQKQTFAMSQDIEAAMNDVVNNTPSNGGQPNPQPAMNGAVNEPQPAAA